MPGDAAQPVELRIRLVRSKAREKLDVLNGKKQLVAAGVVQLETIVRSIKHGDGLESGEAPNAVIGVHDEIANRQACCLGKHIDGAARFAPGPHEAVTQNILFTNDGELWSLKTLL